jgi:ATP-dependent DNA helicase RecQ
MESGFSLLNGQLRQPLFVEFMRQRASDAKLNPELLALLRQGIRKLAKKYSVRLVVPVPSRTWQQREQATSFVAGELGAQPVPELLTWQEWPSARQGELLNNDQRRENVSGRMGLGYSNIDLRSLAPDEAVLLLDDYTGSGATIKEAVRALRQEAGLQAAIVPVTVAQVRWKLGARGMI